MTPAELMTKFFNKESNGVLPCFEWAMWWNLTLDRWFSEGLDWQMGGRELKEQFGLDYDRQFWLTNGDLPECKIENEADYDKYRPQLLNNLKHSCEFMEYKQGDEIVWFTLPGYFWYPRQLFGIEAHLYSFYDHPELYHRICKDMTEHYLWLIDQITGCVSPQFMTFAEDMSYNLGPMLSEDTFKEFIAPYYKQIIPAIQAKGIKVIVDTDGDLSKMIPWLIEAGVDGVLPLERQAGVDVNALTEQYPDFFFIGGYDKMVMKEGEAAMRAEFERIAPAIKRGNYLPSVDHQTPPDVPLENYRAYMNLLRKCQGSTAGRFLAF